MNMSEDDSDHSFADDDYSSESETQQQRVFRIDDHDDTNAAGNAVLLSFRKEDFSAGAHAIRSSEHYDQGSDRFDDEIDATNSHEGERLVDRKSTRLNSSHVD